MVKISKIFWIFEEIKPYLPRNPKHSECGLLDLLLPGVALYLISAVRCPFLGRGPHQIHVISDTTLQNFSSLGMHHL